MTRPQLTESIIRMIAPPHPIELRRWLDSLSDAELEREYRDICQDIKPDPRLTAAEHNAFPKGRW